MANATAHVSVSATADTKGTKSKRPVRIAPSILSADFGTLGAEVERISAAGADYIHIDVMDGHFVPNLTIGPMVVKALRPWSDRPFDIHLMIAPVDPLIDAFVEAGADIVTFHPEAGPHPHRTVQRIRQAGAKPGIALNPATPIAAVEELIGEVDLVLAMTVNPGFGGQAFIEGTLPKIARLRALIEAERSRTGREIDLEVDGGITPETAPRVMAAGADVLVAGTAVFRGGAARYAANIAALRPAAAAA